MMSESTTIGNFFALNIENVLTIEVANKAAPNNNPIRYSTPLSVLTATSEVMRTPASSARTRIVIPARS